MNDKHILDRTRNSSPTPTFDYDAFLMALYASGPTKVLTAEELNQLEFQDIVKRFKTRVESVTAHTKMVHDFLNH